jgi:hypothetical protein
MPGHARFQLARREAEVRGAWAASIGLLNEDQILAASHCSRATAFRVAMLRRGGGLRTLGAWLEGALSLRQIERLVTGSPYDDAEQVTEAKHMSRTARAVLSRA